MKRGILFIITAGVILAAGIWGYSKKQTYTDITSEENYLDKMYVALLPEELTISDCKRLEEEMQHAPIVVKGKAIGTREEVFGTSQQKIEITKVFRGEDLQIGNEIYVCSENDNIIFWDEINTAECSFVNVMKKEKEYLVFLSGEIKTPYIQLPVYKYYGDTLILPAMCYDDENMEQKIVPIGKENTYVPYLEVKNNEFFGVTEKAHEAWRQLKDKMFEVYKQ